MTDRPDPASPRDAELTAYLDRELDEDARRVLEAEIERDPGLNERLSALAIEAEPMARGFDLLLAAAPQRALDERLAAAQADFARGASRGRTWRRLAAIAAALVLFLAGLTAGYFLPRASTGNQEVALKPGEGWRQAVAEYLTFYTGETLATIPDDQALRSRELSVAGAKLDIPLSPESVALPDLNLKRTNLFEFNGRPLAQIAYLAQGDTPIALCIINNGRPDSAPTFEERLGQNIVFWQKAGRGYMLIGKAPRPELERFATTLESRLS